MKDFDVSKAFYRIEYELIDSMIRNFKRHRAEEDKEGFNWEQWQVLQLQELERYRQENPEKFGAEFVDIEQRIEEALRTTYKDAYAKEERHILGRILKYKKPQQKQGWFSLNIGKLEHLITATKADFAKGEWSLLRRANDIYRRVIFDAQMYASAGGTYEQAVDMATKDFLRNGIDCIVYRNGARHTIQDYASMAIRTGQQRAHLMGEGDLHDQYGIHTVRVNQRTNACPLCVGWLGKVLVDDVYSGGTYEEAKALNVPTLSQAMEMGFLHPNCKDTYSLYIEGISKPAEPWTEEEMQEIADNYNIEQAIKHNEAMARSYSRMAKFSLDAENREKYKARAEYWRARAKENAVISDALKKYENEINNSHGLTVEGLRSAMKNNMGKHERDVWDSIIDSYPYTFNSGPTGLNPVTYVININPKDRRNVDNLTFFHETGHRADWTVRIEVTGEDGNDYEVSPSAVIDVTCEADKIYTEIIDYFGYELYDDGDIIGKNNVQRNTRDEYERNKQRFMDTFTALMDDIGYDDTMRIIDSIEGITEDALCEYSRVGGHPDWYWKRRPFWDVEEEEVFAVRGSYYDRMGSMAMVEAFANYCSLKAYGKDEVIKKFAEISPTLVDELEYVYGQVFY